ncbi:MAG: NAD(P)-dependent oxidoreductase [Acidobacteria bacterium]|nr:NAD(P)-dependent oxidoreductase [Acidobacteriota bacterium]MYJ06221.1 NAD(P)-dependent oxidoreductase [Acidobacteriota bacterium]
MLRTPPRCGRAQPRTPADVGGRARAESRVANSTSTPGVAPGRLPAPAYDENFADLHPPYSAHEAAVAADRCYFCHDAPCVAACPTTIDIPLFVRQISTGIPRAAAKTILNQNILGGMCARACPTETLCEQACVREAAEGKPVEIGRLQRFATDALMARDGHPYQRADATGRRVAVVGAGPAGLACAHRLAMKGHAVTLFDARAKAGGLNEFGIASYKTVDRFAEREVEWLLGIGGIAVELGRRLGGDLTLDGLVQDYDAVFLGIGLGGVNALGVGGDGARNVADAIDFIAELRQAEDLATLPVGRHVVVIGGGMTAIDAAVQARLLGAEDVAIVYRQGRERMSASGYEQELATSRGVRIVTNARPVRFVTEGRVRAVEFVRTEDVPDGFRDTEEAFRLPADQVFRAIGQTLEPSTAGLALEGRKIRTAGPGRTSLPGVWAGGDCVAEGDDLVVTAVAQGRDAAEDIHTALMG